MTKQAVAADDGVGRGHHGEPLVGEGLADQRGQVGDREGDRGGAARRDGRDREEAAAGVVPELGTRQPEGGEIEAAPAWGEVGPAEAQQAVEGADSNVGLDRALERNRQRLTHAHVCAGGSDLGEDVEGARRFDVLQRAASR